MKAAVIKAIGNIEVNDVQVPVPGPDEVRVQVKLGGICGSDNSMFHGKLEAPFPLIPGHEAVGLIDAAGNNVRHLHPGQRVTIHPNYFCGVCEMCRKGLTNICSSKIRLGVDIDGVFAEYAVVPASAVFQVPEEMPDEVAVFAEPLAVCLHGIKKAGIKKADRVLVLGAGVIGQLCLQTAKAYSDNITSSDLLDSRLELARSMGAARVFGDSDELYSHQGEFDVIFETTGSPAGLNECIELAAPGAVIVTLGLPALEYPVSTVKIVRKELTIKGSMIYTTEIPESLELLAQGRIDSSSLVSSSISLEELGEALKHFDEPSRMKTLVRIS